MTVKAKLGLLVFMFALFVGGSVFLYYKINQPVLADGGPGCQNTRAISAMFGPPGAKLAQYDFFGNTISIHQYIVSSLDEVQKEIKDKKIAYDFSDVQTFNVRSKRGGGGRSLHSWGIALDINPGRNPQGGSTTDIPKDVIDIFQKNGFFWGGNWTGRTYDPMHFEWYGAEIVGQTVNALSKQRVMQVATFIDGSGSPNTNGDYTWILPAGDHEIKAAARAYKENVFPVDLTCFSQNKIDIAIEPLAENVPAAVSGKVSITGNYPLLMPANILLDGKLVTLSTVKGDYTIPNVSAGKHKIEAKLMFFPGGSTLAELLPGDNIKNVNIMIGK